MTKASSSKKEKTLASLKKSPYRRFFCQSCLNEVKTCIDCDYNQKYCPACKIRATSNKNKKSNSKYRSTLKGKKTRAACESRRRAMIKKRIEDSLSCKIMGDPSTKIAKVLPNEQKAEVTAQKSKNFQLKEDKISVTFFKNKDTEEGIFRTSPQQRGLQTIFCTYCFRECSNYSYNKLFSKRFYKQKIKSGEKL